MSALAISTDPKNPITARDAKDAKENQDQETELSGPETMSELKGHQPFVSVLLPWRPWRPSRSMRFALLSSLPSPCALIPVTLGENIEV